MYQSISSPLPAQGQNWFGTQAASSSAGIGQNDSSYADAMSSGAAGAAPNVAAVGPSPGSASGALTAFQQLASDLQALVLQMQAANSSAAGGSSPAATTTAAPASVTAPASTGTDADGDNDGSSATGQVTGHGHHHHHHPLAGAQASGSTGSTSGAAASQDPMAAVANDLISLLQSLGSQTSDTTSGGTGTGGTTATSGTASAVSGASAGAGAGTAGGAIPWQTLVSTLTQDMTAAAQNYALSANTMAANMTARNGNLIAPTVQVSA